MKKAIRITMPDQSQWDVPAELVAHNRAAYYATKDTGEMSGENYTKAYKKEMEYALKHNYELIDWASNNMNWDDVKFRATLHKAGILDYQDGWINGTKQVIQLDPDPD